MFIRGKILITHAFRLVEAPTEGRCWLRSCWLIKTEPAAYRLNNTEPAAYLLTPPRCFANIPAGAGTRKSLSHKITVSPELRPTINEGEPIQKGQKGARKNTCVQYSIERQNHRRHWSNHTDSRDHIVALRRSNRTLNDRVQRRVRDNAAAVTSTMKTPGRLLPTGRLRKLAKTAAAGQHLCQP